MNIEERLAVEDLLVRYCTAIDTKDWELFRSCFTANARANYGLRMYETPDALTQYMAGLHAPLDGSLHRMTNMTVTVGQAVRARSYVAAVLVRRDHPDGSTLRAEGIYDDVLSKAEGEWRIEQRRFTSVWQSGNAAITGVQLGP